MDIMNERIKSRRLELNMTLKELSKKIGVRDATIQRYECGEIKNIKRAIISKLAIALECSEPYLFGWTEDAREKPVTAIPKGYDNIFEPDFKDVLMLREDDYDDFSQHMILREQSHKYISTNDMDPVDFCLKMPDDSMTNIRIKKDDIVFVKNQTFAYDRDVIVVDINSIATLRRYYKQGSSFVLVAENSDYPPMVYTDKQITKVKILGKVLSFQSKI